MVPVAAADHDRRFPALRTLGVSLEEAGRTRTSAADHLSPVSVPLTSARGPLRLTAPVRSRTSWNRYGAWLGGTVLASLVVAGLVGGCALGPAGSSVPQRGALLELVSSSAWQQAAAPKGVQRNDFISSVSCADADHCWAAGFRFHGSASEVSLVEQYEGTAWSVEDSPSVSNSVTGADQDALYGIACPSATDCWAVGEYYQSNTGEIPLIEHYDGSKWTVVPGPTDPALSFSGGELNAITCLSSNDCWAVGEGTDTLVEQFNGTGWSIVPSAQAGTGGTDDLIGITCAGPDACWAVGTQGLDGLDTTKGQPLIESYSGGGRWIVDSSPRFRTATQNQLRSVSCSGVGSCWAVGSLGPLYRKKHLRLSSEPLIEQLSGGSWRVALEKVASGGYLDGVSCPGNSGCLAVGGDNGEKGMIESLRGSRWLQKTGVSRLPINAVACISSRDCWSVGPASGQAAPSNSRTTYYHN